MPIKNEKSEVVLFLVSHKDITENKDLDHGNESDTGKSQVFLLSRKFWTSNKPLKLVYCPSTALSRLTVCSVLH